MFFLSVNGLFNFPICWKMNEDLFVVCITTTNGTSFELKKNSTTLNSTAIYRYKIKTVSIMMGREGGFRDHAIVW